MQVPFVYFAIAALYFYLGVVHMPGNQAKHGQVAQGEAQNKEKLNQ